MISLPPRIPEPLDLTSGMPESVREVEESLKPRKVTELWIGNDHFDVMVDPLLRERLWELRGG